MNKIVFRSRVDWWVWTIPLFAVAVSLIACIGSSLWFKLIYGVGYGILMFGLLITGIYGCWYTVEGDSLLVYNFFRPTRLTISKIKEIKYCRGFIAGPAASTRRLSIKFTDRSVLKSSMPIEISPRDLDAFVKKLLQINPDISVIGMQ